MSERFKTMEEIATGKEDALRWIAYHIAWKDQGCLTPQDVRPGKTQDCDACPACFSRIAREALEPRTE